MELKDLRNKEFINSGRNRTAYKVNDKVVKMSEFGSDDNSKELEIYEKYKDTGYFNPCSRITEKTDRYIECDYCESLSSFFRRMNIKISSGKLYDGHFKDIIKEYPILNQFLVDAWENIESFCVNVLGFDWREINYCYNLGYNPSLNKIVIIDYAE